MEQESMGRESMEPEIVEDYGFRPSLKNLQKLDLMPDNEVIEKV